MIWWEGNKILLSIFYLTQNLLASFHFHFSVMLPACLANAMVASIWAEKGLSAVLAKLPQSSQMVFRFFTSPNEVFPWCEWPFCEAETQVRMLFPKNQRQASRANFRIYSSWSQGSLNSCKNSIFVELCFSKRVATGKPYVDSYGKCFETCVAEADRIKHWSPPLGAYYALFIMSTHVCNRCKCHQTIFKR